MPRAASAGTAALDKGLDLLTAVARDGGATPLRLIAARLGLPASTARRMIVALDRRGLAVRVAHGRYAAGYGLVALAATADTAALLARVARPVLSALAHGVGVTAHLGILEGDMVTYLVKEAGGGAIFTREREQLEAYCSGVGKVLLAALPDAAREAYLAAGAFVALTERTITDPARLRDALALVGATGHAIDDEEVAPGLYCIAIPLPDANGTVVAALSLSGDVAVLRGREPELIERLRGSAATIGVALWPGG